MGNLSQKFKKKNFSLFFFALICLIEVVLRKTEIKQRKREFKKIKINSQVYICMSMTTTTTTTIWVEWVEMSMLIFILIS